MTRGARQGHSSLLGQGQDLQLLWPGRLSEEAAWGSGLWAGHTVALRANLQVRHLPQEGLGEEGMGRNGEEGEEGEGVFVFHSMSYTWSSKKKGALFLPL